jgi:tRNA 2-thiouridine synthesizing protein A
MPETMELNCLGMKCPRPIIEIAKAARRAAPGAVLTVHADDLAFESDVQAWCENAGAKLAVLSRDGKMITAVVELPSEAAQ